MRMNIDTVWTLEVKNTAINEFVTIAIYSARYRAMNEVKKRISFGDTAEYAIFRYKLDELVSYERVPIK